MAVQDGNGTARNRLSWYDHVMCRGIETQIREAPRFKLDRKRRKGRPRKTWILCMRGDMERLRLSEEDTQDRECRET